MFEGGNSLLPPNYFNQYTAQNNTPNMNTGGGVADILRGSQTLASGGQLLPQGPAYNAAGSPIASDAVRRNNYAIDQRRVAEGGEDFGVADFGQLTDAQRQVVRDYRKTARTPEQIATARADQARRTKETLIDGKQPPREPTAPVKQFAAAPQQAPVQAITNRTGSARAGALRAAAADSSRSRIAAENKGG